MAEEAIRHVIRAESSRSRMSTAVLCTARGAGVTEAVAVTVM